VFLKEPTDFAQVQMGKRGYFTVTVTVLQIVVLPGILSLMKLNTAMLLA